MVSECIAHAETDDYSAGYSKKMEVPSVPSGKVGETGSNVFYRVYLSTFGASGDSPESRCRIVILLITSRDFFPAVLAFRFLHLSGQRDSLPKSPPCA